MADNTQVQSGTGDTIRDVDNSAYTTSPAQSAKTQVVKPDVGGRTGEALVSLANPMPTLESSGNIAMILLQILAELRALRLQYSAVHGVHVEPLIETLSDTTVN